MSDFISHKETAPERMETIPTNMNMYNSQKTQELSLKPERALCSAERIICKIKECFSSSSLKFDMLEGLMEKKVLITSKAAKSKNVRKTNKSNTKMKGSSCVLQK